MMSMPPGPPVVPPDDDGSRGAGRRCDEVDADAAAAAARGCADPEDAPPAPDDDPDAENHPAHHGAGSESVPPPHLSATAGRDRGAERSRRGRCGAPPPRTQNRPPGSSREGGCCSLTCGGARGIRTPDLLIANETRYQLRH